MSPKGLPPARLMRDAPHGSGPKVCGRWTAQRALGYFCGRNCALVAGKKRNFSQKFSLVFGPQFLPIFNQPDIVFEAS